VKFCAIIACFFCYNQQNFTNDVGLKQLLKDYQNKWLFWGFLGYVSYALLAPAISSGIKIPHLDKIVHAGIFFVLTFLLMNAYTMLRTQIVILFTVYGALIEILQARTGNRTGDVYDLIADVVGIFILFWTLDIWQKRIKPLISQKLSG
jgi:VanZ family protein